MGKTHNSKGSLHNFGYVMYVSDYTTVGAEGETDLIEGVSLAIALTFSADYP